MSNELWVIITGLFAGTNILQFVFFRASKRKANAEADNLEIQNEQKRLDVGQDARKGIQEQCDDMLRRMLGMQEQLQKYLIEVAELRATLAGKEAEIIRLTKDRDYYKAKYERLELEIKENRVNDTFAEY